MTMTPTPFKTEEMFYEWLEKFHPEVELMAWQLDWSKRYFRCEMDEMISMDLRGACGKTFLTNLIREYQDWYAAEEPHKSIRVSPADASIFIVIRNARGKVFIEGYSPGFSDAAEEALICFDGLINASHKVIDTLITRMFYGNKGA